MSTSDAQKRAQVAAALLPQVQSQFALNYFTFRSVASMMAEAKADATQASALGVNVALVGSLVPNTKPVQVGIALVDMSNPASPVLSPVVVVPGVSQGQSFDWANFNYGTANDLVLVATDSPQEVQLSGRAAGSAAPSWSPSTGWQPLALLLLLGAIIYVCAEPSAEVPLVSRVVEEVVEPVVEPVKEAVAEVAAPVVDAAAPVVEPVKEAVGEAAAPVVDVAAEVVEPMVEEVKEVA